MVRWQDLKADVKDVLGEFKKHKIGLIGVGLIAFMVIIGLMAPVIAPGVAEDWDRGHPRWRANPANAPPVWLDWITRDDYARQEAMSDYEYNEQEMYPIVGEADIGASVPLDEVSDSTISVVDADNNTLEERTITVQEREGVDNLNVSDFTVEPVEGDSYDFAPVEVQISASIEHDGEVEENRTIELDMPVGEQPHADTEWELGPGDELDIFLTHTFRFDGLYAIHLGEHSRRIRVGFGDDVDIPREDVSVTETEDEMTHELAATMSNLVDEERTVRMRVEQLQEREDEPDVYTQLNYVDVEIEPGDQVSDSLEHSFAEPGTYYFVVGDHEFEVDLEEDDDEDDPEEGLSLTTEEEPEYDEPELQQDGVEIISFDAPAQITQGDFARIDIEAENSDTEAREITLMVDGVPVRTVIIAGGGQMSAYEYTFTYDMDYDRVPREIFMEFEGRSDLYRRRIITVERPCEDVPEIEFERLRRGDRVGDISESITTMRRMGIRENIHGAAQSHLRREYDDPYIPDFQHINPVRLAFSEADENWFDDPTALKGQYNFTIRLEGINVEMDEVETHIGGAVYGVFGTDRDRRDIFLGWVWGARYGLYAGGIVALTTILFGTSYGMTSAYYGGWVDELMSRLHEIIMGIPTLPILIIVLEFWSRSINVFVLIYALLMWRGAARVIRARGLQVAQDTYIEAAESLGSGSGRIIFRHMIPQILPYAVAQAALLVPIVIMAEAGLHILGLGDPTIVTWGTILNDARAAHAVMNYEESWFWILFPGVGMVMVGFGFIATGMAIERIINPEMQQR